MLGDFILKVAILTAAIGYGFTMSMNEAKIALEIGYTRVLEFGAKVKAAFNILKNDMIASFNAAVTTIGGILGTLYNIAAGIVNSIRALFLSLSGMVLQGPTFVGGGVSGVAGASAKSVNPNYGAKIGHARGGPVASGGTYLVGEEGPEMFTPSSSGNIIPNDKLGGSRTINITLNLSSFISLSDMENAERVLVPIVRNALRQAV